MQFVRPALAPSVAKGVTHGSFSSLCNTLFRASLLPCSSCLSVFLFHSRRESLAAIFESFLRRPSLPAEIPPTRRVAYIDNNGIHAEETHAGLVTPPVGCTLFETSEKKVKRIPIIQLNPFVVCGSMPLLSPRYS